MNEEEKERKSDQVSRCNSKSSSKHSSKSSAKSSSSSKSRSSTKAKAIEKKMKVAEIIMEAPFIKKRKDADHFSDASKTGYGLITPLSVLSD